jgi:hypothetical protein
MARSSLVDPETLRKLLDYDPETGAFIWKPRSADLVQPESRSPEWEATRFNALHAGKPALTTKKPRGYLFGGVLGRNVYAHRAAWAIVHGEWPEEIDHINGNPTDNRLCNLRAVSRAQNTKNVGVGKRNTSGHIGVSKCSRSNRWVASMTVSGKTIVIGRFSIKEEAANARRLAASHAGFHENHGRRPPSDKGET